MSSSSSSPDYVLRDAREILDRSDREKALDRSIKALREISEELENEPETEIEKIQTGYIRSARELLKKAKEMEENR